MNQQIIQEVLNAVSDDYESAEIVSEELKRNYGHNVSVSEVSGILLELTRKKLVSAFIYESTSGQWQKISHEVASSSSDVWYTTAARPS